MNYNFTIINCLKILMETEKQWVLHVMCKIQFLKNKNKMDSSARKSYWPRRQTQRPTLFTLSSPKSEEVINMKIHRQWYNTAGLAKKWFSLLPLLPSPLTQPTPKTVVTNISQQSFPLSQDKASEVSLTEYLGQPLPMASIPLLNAGSCSVIWKLVISSIGEDPR